MDNELNIIYTLDDAFIPQLGASMTSVIENNKNCKINFYIATDENENTKNFSKLKKFYENYNITINYIECKKYDNLFSEHNLDKWGSNSYYVYWRLAVFDLMECTDAWYLDSDIICMNKIIKPELNNKTVGCVIDSVHSYYNELHKLNSDFKFFNTGTMFVDIEKWKKNKITNKIMDTIVSCEKKFIMADQDYFSYSAQEYIETISPKYNFFVGYDYYGIDNSFEMYKLNNKDFYNEEEVFESKRNVIFYHCLDGVFGRPWEDDNVSPIKNYYNYFKEKSAFPEYRKARKSNIIFSIEKKLEILPTNFYNRIHCFFIKIYLYIKVKY